MAGAYVLGGEAYALASCLLTKTLCWRSWRQLRRRSFCQNSTAAGAAALTSRWAACVGDSPAEMWVAKPPMVPTLLNVICCEGTLCRPCADIARQASCADDVRRASCVDDVRRASCADEASPQGWPWVSSACMRS